MTERQRAPYPADTKAKGWRFELDLERIEQSDTWALTPVEIRPWLLMIWMTAWKQTPCGSLPAGDELIAAHIGMPIKTFVKCRASLMRGWWLADDGRLYHNTVTERVQAMLDSKNAEKTRKAEWRKRKAEGQPGNPPSVPDVSHGTTGGQPPDSHVTDDTGTSTGTSTNTSVPIGTGGKPPPMSPDEIIFGYGLALLTNAGTTETRARSFLGGLRKQHGDQTLIDTLRDCVKAKPLQPLEWLAAALPPKSQATKPGKHAGFETLNYREGITADGLLA